MRSLAVAALVLLMMSVSRSNTSSSRQTGYREPRSGKKRQGFFDKIASFFRPPPPKPRSSKDIEAVINRLKADQKQKQSFIETNQGALGQALGQKQSGNIVSEEFIQLVAEAVGKWVVSYFAFKLVARQVRQLLSIIATEMKGTMNGNPDGSSESIARWMQPNVTLNTYEKEILGSSLVLPDKIKEGMEDIGGLAMLKTSLLELSDLDLYSASTCVHSVLLFGPPGVGKSMLALALAHDLDIPMFRIAPSSLLRKYLGETSLLTKAVFTLASKMQRCVIFLDEVDFLFRIATTTGEDHVRSEFLQLWDELTRTTSRVIIIGTTNRPQDLDAAIQRRFERSFLVSLPNYNDRMEIFRKQLRECEKEANFDYSSCARHTEGYSPSDLASLCRTAVMIPIREASKQSLPPRGEGPFKGEGSDIQAKVEPSIAEDKGEGEGDQQSNRTGTGTGSSSTTGPPHRLVTRPLRTADLEWSIKNSKPTSWSAKLYEQNPDGDGGSDGNGGGMSGMGGASPGSQQQPTQQSWQWDGEGGEENGNGKDWDNDTEETHEPESETDYDSDLDLD